MKRIIKDYKNISQEHADLIAQFYPNGFENENLVSFTTPKGEFIKALEIRTEDTIYLFKIDKNMEVAGDDEGNDTAGMPVGDFDEFKGIPTLMMMTMMTTMMTMPTTMMRTAMTTEKMTNKSKAA